MTSLTPNADQERWIQQFVETDAKGGILGLGTGVGKTLVGTEIAARRGAKRVLILAPQSTFDSWASTVYWTTGQYLKRAANNAFSFDFTPDPNKRREVQQVKLPAKVCQQNLEDAQAGKDGWYFVTRELFQRQDWLVEDKMKDGKPVRNKKGQIEKTRKRLNAWDGGLKHAHPYDVIILDENQKFAKLGNYGQQSFRAVQGFKIASSADWFGSAIENMHTVAVDVFGKEAIPMTKAGFIADYMETEYDHFAYDKKRVTAEQWPGLFASELPLYVTAPPSVTPPEPEIRHVTLSSAERKLYDQLEANYVAMVGDEILNIEVPLTLRARLRELSLGMFRVVKTGEFTQDGIEKTSIEFDEGAPSSKLDEIRDILADHPDDKFVIYSHSAKWCRKAAADLGGRAWTGDLSDSEKADIKREFIQGDLRLFTATVETMGTGTDGLQAVCNNVIVASESDQVIANTQGISRIARQGQTKQVNVWKLVARNTFDAGVIRRNGQKVAVNNGAKGWG